MDAAKEMDEYCWGLFRSSLGTRHVWLGKEANTQQCAELGGLLGAIRLAPNRGLTCLSLVGDNESSLYQALGLRSKGATSYS